MLIVGATAAVSRRLIGGLADFQLAHRSLSLHLHDITAAIELQGIDIAVLDQSATEPSVEFPEILHEKLTPVCSQSGVIPNSHAALVKSALLHLTAHPDARINWFAAAGFTGSPDTRWPVSDDVNLATEATTQGPGIAIAPAHTVKTSLCTGRLTTPFPVSALSCSRYHLACPEANGRLQKV